MKITIREHVLNAVFGAIFPAKCLFCENSLDDVSANLGECCQNLVKYSETAGDGHLSRIYANCAYDEPVRDCILKFKYGGEKSRAKPMAEIFYENLKKSGFSADFLVPVPLSDERFRKRGFNQAALLAAWLGHFLKIPTIEGLVRQHDTEAQFGLSVEERLQNLQNAFAVAEGFNPKNRRIALVDDILTTGATAQECAKILMMAGAAKVDLVIFAQVK